MKTSRSHFDQFTILTNLFIMQTEKEMMEVDTASDTKFRIQVVSDLHIEFGVTPNIEPHAPHLALLGDIGIMYGHHADIYKDFLVTTGWLR
jgi:hypothetical protein